MKRRKSGSFKKILREFDKDFARVMIPWIIRHPKYFFAAPRLSRSFNRSERLRLKASSEGLVVPPYLILSITNQCNLRCAGCYAASVGTIDKTSGKPRSREQHSLDKEKWREIISEARDLGVLGFILAGGEPFMFPGLLDLVAEFKELIFVIFTNGTVITDQVFKRLKKLANVAVIASIEGNKKMTDERRGKGVYDRVITTIKKLNKAGVFSGISVTVNTLNYDYWIDHENVDTLIRDGVRMGFFLEYIPSKLPGECASKKGLGEGGFDDSILMLSPKQRAELRKKILDYRANKKIILVHSPGDEEFMGGCISAGRGFAHVTPAGDVTPCPVSDIATHNLKHSSLRDALGSELFEVIRESEHLLETEGTPCALYAHQEEVETLMNSIGAYRANS
ncbi:MAG: radical SAM/SPASM domain-containing protein [Candidatus Hodarchaeota archaeon]